MPTNNERVGVTLDILPGTMAGVAAAATGFNELVGLVSQFSNAVAKSTSTMDALNLTMGAVLFTGAYSAAKAFGELERSMKIVQAVSGQTESQINVLTSKANEFSINYRVGIDDITEGLQTLGRAGLSSVNTQLDTMQAGLQAAKIEGMQLSDALEQIVSTTSLLGGDINSSNFGKQSQDLTNKLIATSLSAPIDMNDVVQTLQYSGGFAAAGGMGIKDPDKLYDYLGAISAFAQKGVKGSMAGTAMRAFFTKPVSQERQVVDALNTLDMKASDLWEESGDAMRPISEQIDLIHSQMEELNLSIFDQIDLWDKIVGPKMSQQMIKLDGDAIKRNSREIRETASATELANTTMNNFLSDLEEAGQKAQKIWRDFGQVAISIFKPLVFMINKILDLLNFSPGGFPIFKIFMSAGLMFTVPKIMQSVGSLYRLLSNVGKELYGIGQQTSKTEKEIRGQVAAETERLQKLGLSKEQANALASSEKRINGGIGTSNKLMGEFLLKLNEAVAAMTKIAVLTERMSMDKIVDITNAQHNRLYNGTESYLAPKAWFPEHEELSYRKGFLTKGEFSRLAAYHGMSIKELREIYDSSKFREYYLERQGSSSKFPTAFSLEKFLEKNNLGLYSKKSPSSILETPISKSNTANLKSSGSMPGFIHNKNPEGYNYEEPDASFLIGKFKRQRDLEAAILSREYYKAYKNAPSMNLRVYNDDKIRFLGHTTSPISQITRYNIPMGGLEGLTASMGGLERLTASKTAADAYTEFKQKGLLKPVMDRIKTLNTSSKDLSDITQKIKGGFTSLLGSIGPLEAVFIGATIAEGVYNAALENYQKNLEKINSDLAESREKLDKSEEAFLKAYEKQNPNATQEQKDEALLNLYANGAGDRNDGLDSYRSKVYGSIVKIERNTRQKAEADLDSLFGDAGTLNREIWSPLNDSITWGMRQLEKGININDNSDFSRMEYTMDYLDRNLSHYSSWINNLNVSDQAKYAAAIMTQGVSGTGVISNLGKMSGVQTYRDFEKSLAHLTDVQKISIANSIDQDAEFYQKMQKMMFTFSNGELRVKNQDREQAILSAIQNKIGGISQEQAKQTLILSTISSIHDFMVNTIQPDMETSATSAMLSADWMEINTSLLGETGDSAEIIREYVMFMSGQLAKIVEQTVFENIKTQAELGGYDIQDILDYGQGSLSADEIRLKYGLKGKSHAVEDMNVLLGMMGQGLYANVGSAHGLRGEDLYKYNKMKNQEFWAGAKENGILTEIQNWEKFFGQTVSPDIIKKYWNSLQEKKTTTTGKTEDEKSKDKKGTGSGSTTRNRVDLVLCSKKEIPRLNVNLFRRPPTFTILNRNLKLRDLNINTADKPKSIMNAVKNSIIEIQNRSNPKIIQDDVAEYNPVAATDGRNIPSRRRVE